KRLARAVAMSDEIPELMTELKQRLNRMRNLEAQFAAARRTPAELAALIDQVEASVKERLADVRGALADRRDLRELRLGLFPRGLTFSPARTPDNSRAVWKLRGPAVYKVLGGRSSGAPTRGGPNGSGRSGEPAEPALPNPRRDPNGIRTRVTCVKGGCPRPLDDGVRFGG